ncbi:MAG: ArnT family glycosyltransferase [Nitrospinota bacterium]
MRSLLRAAGRWRVPLTPAACGLSLFLLSLAVLWQNALTNPLHESDSALFANMARELAAAPVRTWMRMGGQWEWLFYEKPPLILWVEAAFMRLFGPVSQAAMFPTLAASHLTVWLVYRIGRKLVDREFGFLAALILILTPWFIKLGRLPKIEPLLMFFMTLTLYWGMELRRGPRYVLGTGLALALAFLAKGPPALAVLPVLAVYGAVAPPGAGGGGGRAFPWGRLALAVLVALGLLALVDLWHYRLAGVSYWKRLLTQQLVPGVLTGREQAGLAKARSPFYYFRILGVRYWPWLPVLLAGLAAPWLTGRGGRRGRGEAERAPLVRAWAFGLTQAGTLLIGFSLVPKKWAFYLHPYHVGLSLLTAIPVYLLLRRRREVYGSLAAGGVVLALVLFILASVFPPLFSPHPRPKLNALIRLGEQLRRTGQRIDTLQLANVCNRIGHWSLRWPARFYLDVKTLTCGTRPEGYRLVDVRGDRSYERDGSRVRALSYPYVVVERRGGTPARGNGEGEAVRPPESRRGKP